MAGMISGTYTRTGPCAFCGKTCTRSRTFTGLSMESVQIQAEKWVGEIWHKKCGLS